MRKKKQLMNTSNIDIISTLCEIPLEYYQQPGPLEELKQMSWTVSLSMDFHSTLTIGKPGRYYIVSSLFMVKMYETYNFNFISLRWCIYLCLIYCGTCVEGIDWLMMNNSVFSNEWHSLLTLTGCDKLQYGSLVENVICIIGQVTVTQYYIHEMT